MHQKLYTPENLVRANYARVAMIIATIAICGYLVISTAMSMREILSAGKALRAERQAVNRLRLEASDKRRRDASESASRAGGVESFALTFSQWAKSYEARIESITPEGSPVPSNVSFGDVKLGTWNASRVRVQGKGNYDSFMSLVDKLKSPGMPAKLESFSVETCDSRAGTVNFDLVLTIYEKAGGTS